MPTKTATKRKYNRKPGSKKPGPAPGTGGRPTIQIDFEEVKKLCALFCTGVEIAWFLGISTDTLDTKIQESFDMSFSAFFKIHSSDGKISLRRKQFESAMNGNTALLIFLGKNYLGQTDKERPEDQDSLPESVNIGLVEIDASKPKTD